MTKTIGIFLPDTYKGGTLRGAKNIAKMLHLGSQNAKEPIKIVFSCVANHYPIQDEFSDLIKMNIQVRETKWKIINKQEVQLALSLGGKKPQLMNDFYALPTDGMNNFSDCDFWFIISDRLDKPLAPLKPYGMMIYDYIQRYLPEIFPESFNDYSYLTTARHANFILTTTPHTRDDVIQYAGVSPNKVLLIPMDFNPPPIDLRLNNIKENYFIWVSNSTRHKNHLKAIEALEMYYSELEGQLKIYMTGVFTDWFNPQQYKNPLDLSYITAVNHKIENSSFFKKNFNALGNLSEKEYVTLLSGATFLWHPTLIDNGTYSVIEAAYCGVPSLSSDYPQMHYINELFNLNLAFFDPNNSRTMAHHLKKMEIEHQCFRASLPSRDYLIQFSYENLSNSFWELFRKII